MPRVNIRFVNLAIMLLVIGRTFKESLSNFVRNGWLSIAAVSVLLLSLFIIGMLFMVTKVSDDILSTTQNKINVSAYLKSDVSEDRIMEIKKEIEGYPDIQSVQYISRDQALEDFKKNNAGEPVIIQSLEEIGENPLLASVVIKANSSDNYEAISNQILDSDFKDDISRVNYGRNKEIIEKLNNLINETKKIGLALVGLFSVISILIIFNTIRITIYTHKQEIEVMRLVGASNTYIRLPFVFEGIIYGFIATVISLMAIFGVIKFISSFLPSLFPSGYLSSLFLHNLLTLLGIQVLAGVILGVLSSMIAIRKYLKI